MQNTKTLFQLWTNFSIILFPRSNQWKNYKFKFSWIFQLIRTSFASQGCLNIIVKHDLNRLKIRDNSRFVGSEMVVGSSEQDSLVEKGCNWNGPQSHLGPWLFWSPRNVVPKKCGPQEIWSPRNLDPNKFGLWEICSPKKFEPRMKIITWLFHAGPKPLGDQISWGPKMSGVPN